MINFPGVDSGGNATVCAPNIMNTMHDGADRGHEIYCAQGEAPSPPG